MYVVVSKKSGKFVGCLIGLSTILSVGLRAQIIYWALAESMSSLRTNEW